MGDMDGREISAVKGGNNRPYSKLLFAALIFSILFLAACEEDFEQVTSPPVPPPVPGPDLTVTINSIADMGIVGFPSQASLADVTFTVSNVGALDTGGGAFWVDFFGNISPAPALGAAGEDSIQLAPGVVAAGTSFPQTVTFTTAASGGAAYTIVDSQGDAIVESNEGNNVSTTFGWTFSRPDLTIVITSITPDCCGFATVNFTITNNGLFATDGTFFDVDFFADPGFVPVLGVDLDQFTSIGPIIASGGSFPAAAFHSLLGFPNGTAYVMVNSTLFITEMNVTNNVSAGFAW